MKKFLTKFSVLAVALLLALALVFALGFAACGSSEETGDGEDDETDETEEGEDEKEEEFVFSYGKWVDDIWTYTNASGTQAEYYYSVFVPTAYEEDNTISLSLVTYIPDSSLVFNSSETALYRTKWEAINGWITEDNMTKNPTFILLFGSTSGFNFTDAGTSEGDQALKIMDAVIEKYNIDEDRQYLTGQSMGGIADFYLNDKYPNRFAATVYVGCQPGGTAQSEDDPDYYRIINNKIWEKQKFVYICSRLDGQAPLGQDDMIAVLQEDNIQFGGGASDEDDLFNLNYKDLEGSNALVEAELEKGYSMNFFGFDSVTNNKKPDNEHMSSFEYCYSLNSIYDWLLSQTRDTTADTVSANRITAATTGDSRLSTNTEGLSFAATDTDVDYDFTTNTYTLSGTSQTLGENLATDFWGGNETLGEAHKDCQYITFEIKANAGETIKITTYNGNEIEKVRAMYGTDVTDKTLKDDEENLIKEADGVYVLDVTPEVDGDWTMKLEITYSDGITVTYRVVLGTFTPAVSA